MTDETNVDPIETPVTSSLPDGPTDLPAVEAGAEPNLNPPPKARAEPEEPKKKPEPAYKHDPRNAIYAKRNQRQAEAQAASDEVFNEGRQTTGLPREEPAEPETPVATPDEFVTVKVYGEERRVPKSDVDAAGGIAAYQKTVAAAEKARINEDRARLQEEERRLLQIRDNLRNGLDENGQPLAPKPPVTGVPASTISKEALGPTIKALYSGDEDAAAAAFAEVLQRNQGQQQIPTSEIVRAVEAQVLERIETRDATRTELADVNEANRIFREDFKDIANDPDMMIWAKGIANALTSDPANSGKSRSEIAKLVGSRIHEKLGKAPTTELQQRRTLKSTLPQTTAGSGRVPEPKATQFPTNADYIQTLRRNSGSNSVPR